MIVTDPAQPRLTPREVEVLRLLCSGITSYADLTEALCVSPNTLHYHIEQLRMKLNVSDRVQIVAYAHVYGLVDELEWRGGQCA